jgi:uncharacterized membrane protein
MESKTRLFGHSVHPMLITFPVGLFITAVVFDVIHLATKSGQWALISYWMIIAGIVGGLVAALFGFLDYRGIPSNSRAQSVGRIHGLGNVVVVALFGASAWLRSGAPEQPPVVALVLGFAAIALATITAWLGGELVERLGVGVHEGANVNAPSSLSGQKAVGP